MFSIFRQRKDWIFPPQNKIDISTVKSYPGKPRKFGKICRLFFQGGESVVKKVSTIFIFRITPSPFRKNNCVCPCWKFSHFWVFSQQRTVQDICSLVIPQFFVSLRFVKISYGFRARGVQKDPFFQRKNRNLFNGRICDVTQFFWQLSLFEVLCSFLVLLNINPNKRYFWKNKNDGEENFVSCHFSTFIL